jgi:flagella basal body P-ring formation protein FlgA
MDQPTSDLPQRASRVTAHRADAGPRAGSSARAVRLAPRLARRATSRLLTRMVVSVALWVAGGIVLLPGSSQAQEASGPIVIAGPAEKNPAALAELAQQMKAVTPAQREALATALAAAAQSGGRGPRTNDRDAFTRAADANGAIVIPGAGEAAAAPAMIRTSFKPDANGVVTIPAPGSAAAVASMGVARVDVAPPARRVQPMAATPVSRESGSLQAAAASEPQGAGFDSLASRGLPPQFGANGKPIVTATAMPARTVINRVPAVVQPAPVAVQKNLQPAVAVQPVAPSGQQEPGAIRAAALAFLQQQAAGLPGKVDITVAPAFPRGLSACTALEPFMPTGSRMWGRTTVGVRCAGERPWTIYLQARVSLRATYYLAARAMASGEVLTAADLVARDGDLTGLPQAIVTDPSQAIGSVSLMRIAAGMPLRRDMLKSASAVAIGQTVRVVAAGDGFSISAEGSAMNNASPGQQIRVKTANGQIISGIVRDGGTVEIQL